MNWFQKEVIFYFKLISKQILESFIKEIEALEKNKKEFLKIKQQKEAELRYNYEELTTIEEELV